MRKNYGVSYKGSKSRICDKLAEVIPHEGIDNFYDLFCGGCAVTHKMLLEDRYRHIHCNDLNGMALLLFVNGVGGEYKDEKRWISREEFFKLKDKDPYVSCCWSFGNNQRDYIYARKIEPYKKACHYAIVLDDFSLFDELCPEVAGVCREALEGVTDIHERRMLFGPAVVKWLKAHGTKEMLDNNPLYSSCHTKKDTKTRPEGTIRNLQSLQSLERLERLQSLQSLESLESLQSLQSLQSLEVLRGDYRDVPIPPRSVVYCDPPYQGTNCKAYSGGAFDHAAFWEWARSRPFPVYVSEYHAPEDFAVWCEIDHNSRMSAKGAFAIKERVFVHRRYAKEFSLWA